MDFIPLFIALLSALAGIVGNTWDAKESGIKKLKITGWVIACMAIVSFSYGSWVLHQKNRQISQITEIRKIAHLQIIQGIDFMTRHLRLGDESLDERLRLMTASKHLDEIGKRRLVHFMGLEGGVVSDGVDGQMGNFEQPYQLYDANIKHGRFLLDDVIIKYSQYLQPETVISVSKVLHDTFFLNTFMFSNNKLYFEQGLHDEKNSGIQKSPWNYLGLYYFNRVYWGDGIRSGDTGEFNAFIGKLKKLLPETQKGKLPNNANSADAKSRAAD